MNLNYNLRIYSIRNRNYNSVTLSFVIFSPPRYLLPTIIKRSRNEIGIKKIYFTFTKNILNSIYTECVLLKRANQWKLCLGYMKFQSWQVSVWSQVYVCIRLVHWACDELTFHIHCYKSAGFSIVSCILRMLFGLRMKISFRDEWKLIGR